ncbi:aspartate--tRNA ligase dps1 [Podila humilis]|nr:aspartate--tRNA ligase dps1 [Podila humilis]
MYGKMSMNKSENRPGIKREHIADICAERIGEKVWIRARVQSSRSTGRKICFLHLRQSTYSIQGVVAFDDHTVSKQMVKFAQNIPCESMVLVEGTIVKPIEPAKRCTVHGAEILMSQLFITSEAQGRLPFSIQDASCPEAESDLSGNSFRRIGLSTRLKNRVLDLRTAPNQAIFRLQHAVAILARNFLQSKSFIELHTPRLVLPAEESFAFSVKYFDQKAVLSSSSRRHHQLAISSDFERTFEICCAFPVQYANTHHQLTQYSRLDIEMVFEEHYHEILSVLDELLVHIFTELETTHAAELDIVRYKYQFKNLEFLPTTLRLTYSEAVALMRASGIEVTDGGDLSNENVRALGRLVKDYFKTDVFLLDKYPLDISPFYAMPDSKNPQYSNAYAFYIRGKKVLSGCQRIEDPDLLIERAQAHDLDPEPIQSLANVFRMGVRPHGGGGMGLERFLFLYLDLNNIRNASLFPRDSQLRDP